MRQIALITGGSRGIGRACVELLARQGWSVIFLCRGSLTQAEALCASLREEGCDVAWRQCDLADPAATEACLQTILRQWHHIDLLVNNAGISWHGLLSDMSDADWDALFQVNVKAAFQCIRAVTPSMLRLGKGNIINISSMWGQVGGSCEVAYSASKAALIGLTKALAKELGPSGIRVNCVAPGVIDTDMNAMLGAEALQSLAEETPLERIGTPEEVARAVSFLAGEDAAFITGQVLGVNGGMII